MVAPVLGGVVNSNFVHLRGYDEQLFRLGGLAERYFPEDPNTSQLKLRRFQREVWAT
jgi:type I restriction enzyme R subunit